jgi:hypothetical protein
VPDAPCFTTHGLQAHKQRTKQFCNPHAWPEGALHAINTWIQKRHSLAVTRRPKAIIERYI